MVGWGGPPKVFEVETSFLCSQSWWNGSGYQEDGRYVALNSGFVYFVMVFDISLVKNDLGNYYLNRKLAKKLQYSMKPNILSKFLRKLNQQFPTIGTLDDSWEMLMGTNAIKIASTTLMLKWSVITKFPRCTYFFMVREWKSWEPLK